MISQQEIQDIDLWEIWIEFDQFNPNHFGILYVLGETMIGQGSGKSFFKKTVHEDGQLVLQLPERPERGRIEEVLYSESVDNLAQYSSVFIYAGDELIASFDEIEIVV
jgi:hypothetical protein